MDRVTKIIVILTSFILIYLVLNGAPGAVDNCTYTSDKDYNYEVEIGD